MKAILAAVLFALAANASAATAFLQSCHSTSSVTGEFMFVGAYNYGGRTFQQTFPGSVGWCPQTIEASPRVPLELLSVRPLAQGSCPRPPSYAGLAQGVQLAQLGEPGSSATAVAQRRWNVSHSGCRPRPAPGANPSNNASSAHPVAAA